MPVELDDAQRKRRSLEWLGSDGYAAGAAGAAKLSEIDALIEFAKVVGIGRKDGPTGWRNLEYHRDLRTCKGVVLDADGYVVELRRDCCGLNGTLNNLSHVFGALERLKSLSFHGNDQLSGLIPDMIACKSLERVYFGNCNFEGAIPTSWPPSLKTLGMRDNRLLCGRITAELVVSLDEISYTGCKAKAPGDDDCMIGPFMVGMSMASENIPNVCFDRARLQVSFEMLHDPPKKGDERYTMFKTHGPKWCAWQDLWLDGLHSLSDRNIYVLSGFDAFKGKFRQDALDDERNYNNSFDPTYKLPPGRKARNILDWERLQFLQAAEVCKSISIKHLKMSSCGRRTTETENPKWYIDEPTEDDFQSPSICGASSTVLQHGSSGPQLLVAPVAKEKAASAKKSTRGPGRRPW